MTRLPDIYKQAITSVGHPEPIGENTIYQFYQGDDIIFSINLEYNGKPVTADDWVIKSIVKKNVYATTSLWVGEVGNGIYKHTKEGYYKIIIPSKITYKFLAGSYWLDIVIKQRLGKGDEIRDVTVTLARITFNVDYSAGSPNALKIEGKDMEITYPPFVDITDS